MSNKLESAVWQDFKRVLLPLNVHAERVENVVKSGIFDVAISRSGRTLWVELKRSTKHQLETSQLKWAISRYGLGCTKDMLVIAPILNLWQIYDIATVIRANGILRNAEDITAAVSSECLRQLLKEYFNGR